MSISARLKEAREEVGLSQAELARRAGVSAGTIGNIESGERKNPRELLAIAAAVEVYPLWLKSGRGPKRAFGWKAQDVTGGSPNRGGGSSRELPDPYSYATVAETRVPVKGSVRMNNNEATFTEAEIGPGEGWVSDRSDDPGAYAFRIVGDKLAPVAPHGYFLVVEPGMPCHVNERVLVRMNDGTHLVRQLTSETLDSISVLSVLGGNLETIERERIEWMQPFDFVRASKWIKGLALAATAQQDEGDTAAGNRLNDRITASRGKPKDERHKN